MNRFHEDAIRLFPDFQDIEDEDRKLMKSWKSAGFTVDNQLMEREDER